MSDVIFASKEYLVTIGGANYTVTVPVVGSATITDLSQLPQDGATDGQAIMWNDTASEWEAATPPGAGGGEANTISSAGSGTSLYYTKVGVDLQLNAIKSENSMLEVDLDAVTHDIELKVRNSLINHDALTNTHNLTSDIDHDTINNTHNLTTDIDHDALTGFVSSEHVNHDTIEMIAGRGLTGGGYINATRTFNLNILSEAEETPDGTDFLVWEYAEGSNIRRVAVEDLPYPISTVFGRTGAVVAATNDYTWAQIDKTTSSIADITTRSHADLTNIGTNTHAQIDSHIAAVTGNPHGVTKSDVTLGNVTNDAQLKRSADDWSGYSDIGTPASGDVLLLEDADDSGNKKRVQIGNLPTGGGGEANTASSQGTGTSIYYTKAGVDLQFNAIKSENALLTVSLDGVTHDIELTVNEGTFDHDNLTNTHNLTTDIDHNNLLNTHNLTTNIDHDTIANTHNLTTDINHDTINGFVGDEHIDHSGVSISPGRGMSGGGNITATRTMHVDIAGETEQTPGSTDWILWEANAGGTLYKVQVTDLPGGGGGEANTASSQGTGTSIYYTKSGVDLQFNAIKSENNRLSVALDGVSHDVELTVNEANIDHDNLTNTHNLTTDIDHNELTNYAVGEHRTINDAGTGVTDLWSADKINTELGGKSDTGHTHTASNVTDFDTEVANNSAVEANTAHTGTTHDYSFITGNDGATDITAAELEELSDGSATTLHTHADLHTRLHAITSASDHNAGNDKIFYSGNAGALNELALGSSGTFLRSAGPTSAPTFSSIGTGDVPDGADGSAIHDNVNGEISAIAEKGSPVGADMILIEDSAASNAKKMVQITNLPGGADADAIHDNVADEIHQITLKGTPVGADELVIEDSAASWAKKRITLTSLPGGGSHNILSATHTDTTGGGSESQGDLLVRNGSNQWTSLPLGSANTVLHGSATDPSYSAIVTDDISNNAVTLPKFVQATAQYNFLARITAGAGNFEQANPTAVRAALNVEDGSQANTVDSVFGRTDAVTAAASDYDASQIDNDSGVSGTYVSNALDTLASADSTHAGLTEAHGATGAVVGTTNIQTLTNKTLSSPTISNFTNATHGHTIASSGGQLSITAATTGTLTATRGGTAQATWNQGDLLYASATDTLVRLTKGTAHQFLRMNSGATAPEWYRPEDSKSFTFENPADADIFNMWITNKAITITEIQIAIVGGTSVAWALYQGAAINSITTLIESGTASSSTPVSDTSMSGDATVPADQCINLDIGTVTGTVTELSITVHFTED